MKQWIYHGYSFTGKQVKNVTTEFLDAVDGVRHSSVQMYPDSYTFDDVLPLIEAIFANENPSFNVIYLELECLD